MNDQHYRIKQLVYRAYQRAKARHEIRAMGHPLPDPTDPDGVWKVRFEDAIFGLISRAETPRFSVLPGGAEDTPAGRVAAGLRGSGQVPRHGDKPCVVVDEQRRGHPQSFETEEIPRG